MVPPTEDRNVDDEVGTRARPAAADHREHMTAETAEPGTTSTGNPTVTGTLLPAEGRVKRNLAGCGAGEDQPGQTDAWAPAIRAADQEWGGRLSAACLYVL